jgi:hypothetical protein
LLLIIFEDNIAVIRTSVVRKYRSVPMDIIESVIEEEDIDEFEKNMIEEDDDE